MKTKNKEELKAIAADVFKRYPKAQKVAVTSDGMAFITDENELSVKNHAVNNRYEKELSITHFKRDEMEGADAPKTANELIDEINAAKEVEVVEAILKSEVGGKNRKTVVEAANAKLEALKTAK